MNEKDIEAAQSVFDGFEITLEQFLLEALQKPNGSAVQSYRVENGPRMAIAACLTTPEQISRISETMQIPPLTGPVDLTGVTVAELVMSSFKKDTLIYEHVRSPDSSRSVLFMVCGASRMINVFEDLLGLPASVS